MSMRVIRIIVISSIFIFLIASCLIKLPHFLALNNEFPTVKNSVIEGWMKPDAFENINVSNNNFFVIGRADSSQLLISDIYNARIDEGNTIKKRRPGFFMPHPEMIILKPNYVSYTDTLNIAASATVTGNNLPLLVIFCNDKILGSHVISGKDTSIQQVITLESENDNYLGLLFINDKANRIGDRNISIYELQFSNAPDAFMNTRYVTFKKENDNCFHPGFASEAHLKSFYLKELNPKSNFVVTPLPDQEVKHNKTYHSAKAFNNYLEETLYPVDSVNIISYSIHSRRSYILFKRQLKPLSVGIIALLDDNFEYRWWKDKYSRHKVIDETLSYVYCYLFMH